MNGLVIPSNRTPEGKAWLWHHEVSRLLGERLLLPAVRPADLESVIVAPGFSCRLQNKHFTSRAAVHPAELLRSCLACDACPPAPHGLARFTLALHTP
jgi:hypothetical protein